MTYTKAHEAGFSGEWGDSPDYFKYTLHRDAAARVQQLRKLVAGFGLKSIHAELSRVFTGDVEWMHAESFDDANEPVPDVEDTPRNDDEYPLSSIWVEVYSEHGNMVRVTGLMKHTDEFFWADVVVPGSEL